MKDINVMEKALKNIKNGKELAIVTIIDAKGSTPRDIGTNMAVLSDGTIYGTIGGGSLEKHIIDLCLDEYIQEGKSGIVDIPLSKEGVEMICGGHIKAFINVYKKRSKLLIAGGGHIGLALYNAASLLDFDIVIFEDREDFLTEERFPKANELILGEIDENLGNYPIDEDTYIVIVTRGHEYDEKCLEKVIDSNAHYIGAMGSKSKVKIMMNNLREKGISEEAINKVYSPIGLKICDGSPEEIALSIMSEILMVKNNGDSDHMKNNLKNN